MVLSITISPFTSWTQCALSILGTCLQSGLQLLTQGWILNITFPLNIFQGKKKNILWEGNLKLIAFHQRNRNEYQKSGFWNKTYDYLEETNFQKIALGERNTLACGEILVNALFCPLMGPSVMFSQENRREASLSCPLCLCLSPWRVLWGDFSVTLQAGHFRLLRWDVPVVWLSDSQPISLVAFTSVLITVQLRPDFLLFTYVYTKYTELLKLLTIRLCL